MDEVGVVEIVPVLDAALAEEVSRTRDAREQAERVHAISVTKGMHHGIMMK
jgi:hypothetical protein